LGAGSKRNLLEFEPFRPNYGLPGFEFDQRRLAAAVFITDHT
jgi:hypothetical protein